MVKNKEIYFGITIGGNLNKSEDPELMKARIEKIKSLQEKIGINGYVICRRCTQGISGDPKTSRPEHVARYCKGDCKLLDLGIH